MKLLVCISKTPDTTAKISFSGDGKTFITDGVQFIMNPYDEWYALVRALELKEKNGGTVTVINVGDASNDTILRKALAIGADDAIRVNLESGSALNISKQIAEVAKDGYDMIFLGKETIDSNGSEVGAMVSEYLDMPYASYTSVLEVNDSILLATRDIEGGTETVEIKLPAVVSAAKGLAEQRIPNMRGIMMAKRKPLAVKDPVSFEDVMTLDHYEAPSAKSAVKMIDPENMDELVRLLHEEAKVI